MSLTKDDLQQIKGVVKEGFSEAMLDEYPRLQKEMHLVFAQGINELILPRFDEVWKRFDEITEWQEQTDEILQTMYLEMKRGFRFLKSRTEENAHYTDEAEKETKKLIGDHYNDFEKQYVKKGAHEKLERRVKKLELTRS